jgi:hypothetical protein
MKNRLFTGGPDFPVFYTRKDGIDYEAEKGFSMGKGEIRRCGKCGRGVVAHKTGLMRSYCLICGGEVRKVSL